MIDYTLTLYLAKILYPNTFQEVDPMAICARSMPSISLN